MTTQRKVRDAFDTSKVYRVDVSSCTKEGKEEVQQAFFDAGISWECHGVEYKYLDEVMFTNTTVCGSVTAHLMYGITTKNCNMSAKEFLELVYESEQKGHVHAELMLQYAEDAKTHAEPWKLWQSKGMASTWWDCKAHPMWGCSTEYRRKPKTHKVNGVEVPDLRITPEHGDAYWCPLPQSIRLAREFVYCDTTHDSHRVESGLCYEGTAEGKQAAKLHAKAWLGGAL